MNIKKEKQTKNKNKSTSMELRCIVFFQVEKKNTQSQTKRERKKKKKNKKQTKRVIDLIFKKMTHKKRENLIKIFFVCLISFPLLLFYVYRRWIFEYTSMKRIQQSISNNEGS